MGSGGGKTAAPTGTSDEGKVEVAVVIATDTVDKEEEGVAVEKGKFFLSSIRKGSLMVVTVVVTVEEDAGAMEIKVSEDTFAEVGTEAATSTEEVDLRESGINDDNTSLIPPSVKGSDRRGQRSLE